jgi:uncharacterized protein YneF (UPF0154 family)
MGSLRYILIVILALCIGFAAGYFLEYQKVKASETQVRGLMTEMENASRASREQLAKTEAEKGIYKLRILVAEARCDVMERNFGRANERMDALEASLDKAFAPLGDQGIEARDNIRMSLGGIREGLQKLDVKVKAKIEDVAKALDQVMTK